MYIPSERSFKEPFTEKDTTGAVKDQFALEGSTGTETEKLHLVIPYATYCSMPCKN